MSVSPFLYNIINNREIIAANINNPSLPNSLLVQPYSVIYNHNCIKAPSGNIAGYIYPDTQNQATMLWYELTLNHTYLVVTDRNPGTMFRWIVASSDISASTETEECQCLCSKDKPPKFYSFIYRVEQRIIADDEEPTNAILVVEKYLGGYVDNIGNYNTRAYVIDITSLI